jgi:hypothetical protein
LTRTSPVTAWKAVAILAIVVASGLVMGLDLARQPADPPAGLSRSLGVLDEGLWSHNAVNDALFGRARLDGINPMFVTSAPDRLMRLSYAIFGVGIVQTRLPSIALGTAMVLMVGLLLARKDPLAGVVAAWMLATSFLFLSYSRLGLLETPAAAFIVAALALLVLAIERSRVWMGALGGALIAVGVTSKPQAGGAALGVLAGLIVYAAFSRKRAWRVIAACIGGLVVVGSAWVIFVLANLDPAVRAEWRQHALGISLSPRSWVTNAGHYLSSSDGFGTHARPLLIAAVLGLLLQIAAWVRKRSLEDPVQHAGIGWALGAVGTLAVISYSPSRYAVLALPGLALMAGGGVTAARSLLPRDKSRLFTTLILAGSAVAAAAGLVPWGRWAADPAWSTRDVARLLERVTSPRDVIEGGAALVASTDAHRRVFVTFPQTHIDDVCPLQRYHATFVILGDGDGIGHRFFQRTYPGLIAPTNLVARTILIGRPQTIYRVPKAVLSSPCS